MKAILFLCDALDIKSISPNPRKDIEEQRNRANNDKSFFQVFLGYACGRGYNEFVDYGLFALKLNNIFGNEYGDHAWDKNGEHFALSMTNSCLHDDRHDLYQNLPYDIEKSVKENKWSLSLDALIDCINLEGTEDVIYKTKLLK